MSDVGIIQGHNKGVISLLVINCFRRRYADPGVAVIPVPSRRGVASCGKKRRRTCPH